MNGNNWRIVEMNFSAADGPTAYNPQQRQSSLHSNNPIKWIFQFDSFDGVGGSKEDKEKESKQLHTAALSLASFASLIFSISFFNFQD